MICIFVDVIPGGYAITVLHDENSNAKADMFLGIPKGRRRLFQQSTPDHRAA